MITRNGYKKNPNAAISKTAAPGQCHKPDGCCLHLRSLCLFLNSKMMSRSLRAETRSRGKEDTKRPMQALDKVRRW